MTSTSTPAPAALKPCQKYIHVFCPPKTGHASIPRCYLTEINLKKQPTICNVVAGFPANWCSRNKHRNSTLVKDTSLPRSGHLLLISWSKFPSWHNQSEALVTQIRAVTCHQYGMSVLVPQTSFRRETSGGVAKYWPLSQGRLKNWCKHILQ